MTGQARHLTAVPDAGASPAGVEDGNPAPVQPRPVPARPAAYAYPSNPLGHYTYGPDPEGKCPACRWMHGRFGELCPHHVRWADFMQEVGARMLDKEPAPGEPVQWPASDPLFERGQRVWLHGKVECRITNRYWPRAGGSWHYVATAVKGGAEVHGSESFFTGAFTLDSTVPIPGGGHA